MEPATLPMSLTMNKSVKLLTKDNRKVVADERIKDARINGLYKPILSARNAQTSDSVVVTIRGVMFTNSRRKKFLPTISKKNIRRKGLIKLEDKLLSRL